jgi:cystathionine gamma-synthase
MPPADPKTPGLPLSIESWLVAAGRPHQPGEPLNVPLTPASNFHLGNARVYARTEGTAGWEALEEILCGLENATALTFSSGMAAIAAIFDQLPPGVNIALPDDCYQGVVHLAEAGQARKRWTIHRIPLGDTQLWIKTAQTADLLWLESPSNPLLQVADLDRICAAPRKPGAILAVDNTFATPLNQRPLDLGASLSVQSATKFIGGHSDLLLGVVSARDPKLAATIRASRDLNGATPGTLEVFLATRGLRTLALRLERAQSNAQALAERLAAHPNVSLVRYPGLPTHPTHQAARRQLAGYGTIISFDIAPNGTENPAATADAVTANLRLIQTATSLGSVESTIERRARIPGQQHLPPSMLRLSVGIEALEDLWADLDHALRSATR